MAPEASVRHRHFGPVVVFVEAPPSRLRLRPRSNHSHDVRVKVNIRVRVRGRGGEGPDQTLRAL